MLGVHLLTPRDPVQLIVTLEVQTLFSGPVFYLLRNFEKSVPSSHLRKGLKRSYNHLENEVLNGKKKKRNESCVPFPSAPGKDRGVV